MNIYYNYLLRIEYDGTGFAGWQIQKKEKTIQGCISEKLEKLCGHRVNLIGAGRTDSGCHATGQTANFKTRKKLDPRVIKKSLNSLLLPEIYIKDVKEAHQNFHARYSARKKLYRYIILREPSPFLRDYSYPYFGKLSMEKMRKAAQYFKGRRNFTSFCDGKIENRDPFRIIDRIAISHSLAPLFPGKSNFIISVDVEGASFLCHMVRIIVGTLIEVGRGAILPERVREILEAKDRRLAGKTLPAKGLFLMEVYYDKSVDEGR